MISTRSFKELTKENIFNAISSYDIFFYYIPDFTSISRPFKSPLRDDKNAGVRIFKSKTDTFLYKDFAKPKHTFNSIGFVMANFRISFKEALEKINNDFNLGLGLGGKVRTGVTPKLVKQEFLDSIKKYKDIKVVSTPFTYTGIKYFSEYHIRETTLKRFNVKQIKGYFLNYNYFPIFGYAYCFGDYTYKILQPMNDEFKWISNANENVMQGWDQLPAKGDLCIITSSLKDVMTLFEIGYNAIAPQSEAGSIPTEVIEELKERFEKVVILYDNDKPGIASAKLLSKQSGFPYEHLPEEFEEKDPSDLARNVGLVDLKMLIDTII